MVEFVEQPIAEDFDMEALRKLVSGYKKARDEGFAPVNPALEEFVSTTNSEELLKYESVHVPGLSDRLDDLKSQEITPEPFYFVKTHDAEGHKIFINMCGCSEVAAPGHWQNGVPSELEESFSEMESRGADSMQNLRFSLSCTDYIFSRDKQGDLCKVYDVVFNLVVMRHSKVHRQLRAFLVNMAMTWIGQKYNVELKPDYKLPKGKYKGDVVRKHYIRAAKTRLVTEISDEDAESMPSFPLRMERASQPLESLGVPTSVSSTQEPIPALSSYGSEAKGTIPLREDTFEPSIHPMQDLMSHEPADSYTKSTRTVDVSSDLISQGGEEPTKKNCIGMEEQGVPMVSSPPPSEETHGTCELRSCDPCQDMTMQKTAFLNKRMPLIQVKYLGCPVELVIMCLSFPSHVTREELHVWVSSTKLYVEASACEPIMVPLVFPTTPTDGKATLFESESCLEVYLPVLTYLDLLT